MLGKSALNQQKLNLKKKNSESNSGFTDINRGDIFTKITWKCDEFRGTGLQSNMYSYLIGRKAWRKFRS